jgi:RNA polymerase sigma-70 factor (ECF subfamily)
VQLAKRAKRVARAVLHNEPDAEDISQEAITVVLENEESIDDPTAYGVTVAYRAYGVTVAYRAAVKLRWRREQEDLMEELPEARQRQRDLAHDIVNRLFVEDLLRSLPPQQAQAIELRHLMDMPVASVAAYLGVTVNTAKTHLSLGLKALRWLRVSDDSSSE